MLFNLQVSISDAMRAQVRPPSSWPIARQGFGMAKIPRRGKERVLAVQRDGSDRVFDRIGVHLDAAVGQEYLQPVPVAMDIAELLAGEEDKKTVLGTVFLTNGFG